MDSKQETHQGGEAKDMALFAVRVTMTIHELHTLYRTLSSRQDHLEKTLNKNGVLIIMLSVLSLVAGIIASIAAWG